MLVNRIGLAQVLKSCHFPIFPLKTIITLFEKSNFCPKIQFWKTSNILTSFLRKFFRQFFSWNQSCQGPKSPKPQHCHKFFTIIFLTFFLVKSKLSTAKKSKTTTFSRVLHPKKSTIFSGNQSWIFVQKNEDFEQCDFPIFLFKHDY